VSDNTISNSNNPAPQTDAGWSLKKLSISTKIIIGFAVPVVLMVLVSSVVYFSTQKLVDTASWVQHTQKAITKGHLLEKLILDMETGERGFLITGKEAFLEPFVKSEKQWAVEVSATKELVSDNPSQVKRLEKIDEQAQQWLKLAATPEIAQRRKVKTQSISLDHIQTILQNKVGKNILDGIRQTAEQLNQDFDTAKNQKASNLLVSILKDIVDQETGERGFLITGEENFLEPYVLGQKNFNKHISELKSLVFNAPPSDEVFKLINSIKILASKWHDEAALPEIKIRRAENVKKAEAEAEAEEKIKKLDAILSIGVGKKILDDLRKSLTRLNGIYVKSENENAQILILTIAKSMVDQETGQRGFLITGEERFLVPFHDGRKTFDESIVAFNHLVKNAYQQQDVLKKIEIIELAMVAWQEKAAKVEIDARRQINQTGLSQMEFLQRTVNKGIESGVLHDNHLILDDIKLQLSQTKNEAGLVAVLELKNALTELETNFIHFMVNPEQSQMDATNSNRQRVEGLFVRLSVLIDRGLLKNKARTVTTLMSDFRDNMYDWYSSILEPTFYARRHVVHSRSSAAVQIQQLLKQGTGKNILDQARLLLKDINRDFVQAKNLQASNLVLSIEKYLVDQETGERGFIITGDESFLEPYHSGIKNLRRAISELINIANQSFDVSNTKIKINAIERGIAKWQLIAAEPEITLREQVNLGKEKFFNIGRVISQGAGKQVLDELRYQLEDLQKTFITSKNDSAHRLVVAISKDIVDMETGQRGFLITGKGEFLQPYRTGIKSAKSHFLELHKVINAGYHANVMLEKINKLREKTEQWRTQAGEPEIALRRNLNETGASMADVTRLIERETGKNIIDAVRADIADFVAVESELIKERSAQAEAAASISVYQTIFGTLFASLVALLAAGILLRTIIKSLKGLLDATKQVADGDYSVEIAVENNDQIGKLATAFNAMTDQLETSRDKMKVANEDLERQSFILQDKSRELEESNDSLKDTQQKMQDYSDELELSSQYKSDFLATMSHEIRTPMNGVLGMLALLVKSDLNSDQMKKAGMARSSAKSLLSIINDILDFSKVDAGKMELEILDFDLRTLLGDLAETMAIKAQEKGLEIIVNVVGIEHSMVKGDPSRILQVLTNLVGNAIKFTEHGEIIIRADLKESDDDELTLNCSVEDTGIGIPVDQQKNMFRAFHQVDASTTRKYGGTGLGLSIVKKLCELMGGDVQVSALPAGGSCFSFSIKLKTSEQSRVVMPLLNMKALNLLVVDSNTSNREALCHQLEHWGAKVQGTFDGSTALKVLENRHEKANHPFDLVFMDAQLPDMEATQLANAIKNNEHFNAMKLVIMTSMVDSGEAQQFAQQGFSANFPKPLTTSDLFDALAVILEDSKVMKASSMDGAGGYLQFINQGHAETQASVDKSNGYTWQDNMRLLLVEDNCINQEVAKSLLEELGLSCDVANDGEEALHMLNTSTADNPYSLLLMDCQMPIMDGYTTTRNIRLGAGGQRYKAVAIIALTANAMQGDKEKCLEAGMSDYLSKPIDPDQLESVLVKWQASENPQASKG